MLAARKILNVLFPPRCVFCEDYLQDNLGICAECEKQLPYVSGDICPKCGKEECICKRQQTACEKIVVPFLYDMGVREAIIRFKQGNKEVYAKVFAQFIAEKIKQAGLAGIDCITAVPMRHADQYRRGYNQAELLAKAVGEKLALPCNFAVLRKKRKTGKQHTLNKERRQVNLFDAFEVMDIPAIQGKTVLLCDDVLTTGATLNECARTLQDAGAKMVYGVVLATT